MQVLSVTGFLELMYVIGLAWETGAILALPTAAAWRNG